LQHFIRRLPDIPVFSLLKEIMKVKEPFNNNQYWTVFNDIIAHCDHLQCSCCVRLLGKDKLAGYDYSISLVNFSDNLEAWVTDFCNKYSPHFIDIEEPLLRSVEMKIKLGIKKNSSIRLVPPDLKDFPVPAESFTTLDPIISKIAKAADRLYMQKKEIYFPVETWNQVWKEQSSIPSLKVLCAKKLSVYNMSVGTPGGIPNYVYTMDNLWDKMPDAILKMQKESPELSQRFKDEILPLVDEAEEIMDFMMQVDGNLEQNVFPVTFGPVIQSYKGSSGGLDKGYSSKVISADGVVKVSPNGKKWEKFLSDMQANTELIRSDTEYAVRWGVWPKSEMLFVDFNTTEEERHRQFREKSKKIRLFIIANSAYTMLETMFFSPVYRIEKHHGPIMIGSSWSYGGMDHLASKLNINRVNDMLMILADGDISGFDIGVKKWFMDFFYSRCQRYEKRGTRHYDIRNRLKRFLQKHFSQRLTHLALGIWAIIIGAVPSGSFLTSHFDSLINLFYLILFFVHTAKTASHDDRDALLEIIFSLAMVVFGDDFVYNITSHPLSKRYFAVDRYAQFLDEFLGIKLRDYGMRTFLSEQKNGWVTRSGMIFLRYRAVLNPLFGQGKQAQYLPFRPISEYVVRAIVGRDYQVHRGPKEIMMSCIGHAVGTYAANPEAYLYLQCIFEACVAFEKKDPILVIKQKIEEPTFSMKEYARRGITVEELCNGFPTWEFLVAKNNYDSVYHSRTSGNNDYDDNIYC